MRDPAGTPVSQRTSASKQFFLNDTLGSTIALTDTTGAIVRSYTYDPDGNPTTTGTGPTADLKYTGGQLVGSLYHYGARYLDPTTARWTQQDPLYQAATLTEANRYSYVADDPVNGTDPAGLLKLKSVVKTVVGGATALGGAALVAGSVVGTAACLGATKGLEAPECIGLGLKVGALGATGVVGGTLVARQGIRGK